MPKTEHYDSTQAVADAAAEHAVKVLGDAISRSGSAVWVLAGGDSPVEAYKAVAIRFQDALDWSRVTALIGDERVVPFTSEDSNWGQIRSILFESGRTSGMHLLPPTVDISAEDASDKYDVTVAALLETGAALDLVWLGVGPDGHTLSLPPDREDLLESDRLVVPVHDFPIGYSDRISLTLAALTHAKNAVVFATSDSKKDVLKRALDGEDLPITRASRTVEEAGGTSTWLFDPTARS